MTPLREHPVPLPGMNLGDLLKEMFQYRWLPWIRGIRPVLSRQSRISKKDSTGYGSDLGFEGLGNGRPGRMDPSSAVACYGGWIMGIGHRPL
ncbi:MAG: hypothetical protein ABIG67_06245 [Pseudomonadota bacterium]